MVTSIASTAATAATTNTTSAAGTGTNLAADFTTFLTLLTTQLKNQDPSSPVDSNQFTQQLVEFAGVQQQTQTNSLLQQLLAVSQGNQVSSASSFIGTSIKAAGYQAGLAHGTAQFGYMLPAGTKDATVTISNSAGTAVFTGKGSTNAGDNIFSWNGKNSFTGNTENDGIYKIAVNATNAAGDALTATPFITGTVNSASINNGTVVLDINGLQVPESSVTTVTNLQGTPTASNAKVSSGG